MSAYVVAIINVTNPEAYKEYAALTPGTLAQYGGRFVARAGQHETLEGDVEHNRIVLIEFDSMEAAKRWWDSPEYEAAKPLRRANSDSMMFLVDGV